MERDRDSIPVRDRYEDRIIPDPSEVDTIDYAYEGQKTNSKKSDGEDYHESSSESPSTDVKEARPRRRRRGGRGRNRDQGDGRGTDRLSAASADDLSSDHPEGDEENTPSVRHSKIPTWNETISVLVEANMLNHQRSQGSHRGNPRGRGRR